MVLAIYAIVRVERARKERIRTVYVSGKRLFNFEVGEVKLDEATRIDEGIYKLINDITYGFSRREALEKEDFNPRYFVRTHKVSSDVWEGEVVNTWSKRAIEFKTRKELSEIIVNEGWY